MPKAPKPKAPSDTREATISIRVPPAVKAAAERAAKAETRTLANWVEWTIRGALKAAGEEVLEGPR